MATPPSPPSLPPPSPFKKSRVRMRVSASPSEENHPWVLLLLLLSSAVSLSSPAKISYADHCNSTVPESIPGGLFMDPYTSLQLSNVYFSGGDNILRQDPEPSSSANSSKFLIPRSCYFQPLSLRRTRTPGVIHVEGTLTLIVKGSRFYGNSTMGRSRIRRQSRMPRILNRRKEVNFDLSGFWSDSTGKLCMVGPGSTRSKEGISRPLSAVFKLDYPKTSTISTSLVNGTIESLDSDDDASNHFDPISILVYAQANYQYTQLSKVRDSCSSHLNIDEESIELDYSSSCSFLQNYLRGQFKLEYWSDCSSRNCGPFAKDLGFSPSFMSFNQIQCSEDGRLHTYMGFLNVSSYNSFLVPENSLVGEGFWDQKRNRLCLLACRILSTKNSPANASIGDCTIGFSLWFPSVLSIRNRSATVGRIWSNRNKNDLAYFSNVSFRSSEDYVDNTPGLKYKYTEMDAVRKYCVKSSVPYWGKRRYPDGNSVGDMTFNMHVRNSDGSHGWASASVLSIGENIYANTYRIASAASIPPPMSEEMNHTSLNVSYRIRYTPFNSSSGIIEQTDISAEGIYERGTGVLCMVGCKYLSSSLLTKQVNSMDSMDCGILVQIQLAPLNPEAGEQHNGTIRSTRARSDPLYFSPMNVSSDVIYVMQAAESIWRMDVEITMVVISLTLTCIFIGLQLRHVKKHKDVLPSISITMLVILTLGHMIPLVLNFEALFFTNRNRQSVLLWNGGWLEVNEVVVRVMTMVAFLLQFRLLQTAWSARSAEEGKKGFWVAERKALRLCLLLYIAGGLIAWFVDLKTYGTQQQGLELSVGPQTQSQELSVRFGPHRSLWEELILCAGLMLDGFLLPQVILNIFWNSKDKTLAPFFYIGATVVRAMPHLYDAYRARHNYAYLDSSYIYANPERDFYSTAWDIIVPCGGMLLAVIIFLQQRFGGGYILPPRFRKPFGGYETVSEIGL